MEISGYDSQNKVWVAPHSVVFKTGTPQTSSHSIALVLFRRGQYDPCVVEDFDTTSAGGLNKLKNKAKEMFCGLQERDKPASNFRLSVLLRSGEASLEDDESVQALQNHDRIIVAFDQRLGSTSNAEPESSTNSSDGEGTGRGGGRGWVRGGREGGDGRGWVGREGGRGRGEYRGVHRGGYSNGRGGRYYGGRGAAT